jgi:hypothetical protein
MHGAEPSSRPPRGLAPFRSLRAIGGEVLPGAQRCRPFTKIRGPRVPRPRTARRLKSQPSDRGSTATPTTMAWCPKASSRSARRAACASTGARRPPREKLQRMVELGDAGPRARLLRASPTRTAPNQARMGGGGWRCSKGAGCSTTSPAMCWRSPRRARCSRCSRSRWRSRGRAPALGSVTR